MLAIAQETFTENGKPKIVKTVTLELAPKETEKLALETHEGSIQMVLRNPRDDAEPEMEKPQVVTRTRKVYVTRPAPKPPQSFQVEVIRRSKRESVKFKGDGSDEKI